MLKLHLRSKANLLCRHIGGDNANRQGEGKGKGKAGARAKGIHGPGAAGHWQGPLWLHGPGEQTHPIGVGGRAGKKRPRRGQSTKAEAQAKAEADAAAKRKG